MLLVLLTLLAQAAPDPGLQKALTAHQTGNMDVAIREYRAFLQTKPASLEARSNLGVALSLDRISPPPPQLRHRQFQRTTSRHPGVGASRRGGNYGWAGPANRPAEVRKQHES